MSDIVLEHNGSLKSARTTLRRLPKRGAYDRETIQSILDEAFICHVGFVVDGQHMVMPTIHARLDYALPVWAGVLPLELTAGDPEPDPRLNAGIELPEYLRQP